MPSSEVLRAAVRCLCGVAIVLLPCAAVSVARAEGVESLVAFGESSPLLSLSAAAAEGTQVQPLRLASAGQPLPLTSAVLPLLAGGVSKPVDVVLLPRLSQGRLVGLKSRNPRDLPQAVSASLVR